MNRLVLSLTAAAALAGCTPASPAQTSATSLETRTDMTADSLALHRLPEEVQAAFRYNSGVETAMRETLRDTAAWRTLWTRLTSRVGPPVPLPEVDFAREMVLVAALGERTVATLVRRTLGGGRRPGQPPRCCGTHLAQPARRPRQPDRGGRRRTRRGRRGP